MWLRSSTVLLVSVVLASYDCATEIYSNVDKSTIFKSDILNKEMFWDVIILVFSIQRQRYL